MGSNNVPQGCHVYPFTFQIPAQELPSSFKGSYGKIVYSLEANLSRSMRVDSKAKTKFTLVHNTNLNRDLLLMTPQHSTTEKKMKLFASGTVGMDVHMEKTGFHQGEGIKVVASIQNKSSCDIKPKYCLYQKHSYFAKGKRKVQTKDILKEVGDVIPPSASQTVTRVITIPPDMCASILNCNIIKVEYRLRVYLDVKYASDPEIKVPIVILPALQGPDGEHQPAYPAYGSDAFAREGIKVVASIQNKSSRDIKPKYCLYQKCSYFVKAKRRVDTKDILRKVGDVIPPSASQTVTRVIKIPPDVCVSILNCNIIKVEYRLKDYLDVKYDLDPKIKIPIVILPAL
ncbi:arrestin domain-containing protein 3-like [Symphorus nematophorus]